MSTTKRSRTYEWSDPLATAENAKIMSGLDFLKGILDGTIPPPPIANTLDFNPVRLEEGLVVFEFIPQEFHFNPIGCVHGGVISTLLDTVMGCALQSKLPMGLAYTTLELKTNFTKAVTLKTGKMIAEGRIIHSGKSTGLVEGKLFDEAGKLYAHGTSTCMIFPVPA